MRRKYDELAARLQRGTAANLHFALAELKQLAAKIERLTAHIADQTIQPV